MLLLLPVFVAAIPFPNPRFSLFGGTSAQNSTERNICIADALSTTALKPIFDFFAPDNVSSKDEMADLARFNSLQTTDVRKTPFSSDFTNPAWISVFTLHAGISYCFTDDAKALSKFGDIIPELPEGLPAGKFKVDSINDFNQFEGGITKILDVVQNKTDGRFVISVSDDQKLIVLSWRGSQVVKDFAANFDGDALTFSSPQMTPFLDGSAQIQNPKCKLPSNTADMFMFSGFAKDMQSEVMIKYVVPKLRDVQARYPGYSIVINGHSLGATKAFITAFYLSKFYTDINFRAVYSIEQPLIGSTALATWMADCIGPQKIIRVVSSDDVVPWMRFAGNIQHPATVAEVFNVDSNTSKYTTCQGSLDPRCSAKYTCGERNWDHHSRIGGLTLGGPLCHYIGLGPAVKKSGFEIIRSWFSKNNT